MKLYAYKSAVDLASDTGDEQIFLFTKKALFENMDETGVVDQVYEIDITKLPVYGVSLETVEKMVLIKPTPKTKK